MHRAHCIQSQDVGVGGKFEMCTRPGLGGGKAAEGQLLTRYDYSGDDSTVWDQGQRCIHHQLFALSEQLLDRLPCQLNGLQHKSHDCLGNIASAAEAGALAARTPAVTGCQSSVWFCTLRVSTVNRLAGTPLQWLG